MLVTLLVVLLWDYVFPLIKVSSDELHRMHLFMVIFLFAINAFWLFFWAVALYHDTLNYWELFKRKYLDGVHH